MTEEVFKKLYGRLNKKQKLAVDTIEGPVMVIAGPGTGKTTILTLRIANILRLTDTPPSGILAITYTEAGVRAMRTKLREIIGSRAEEVRLHTFHSFAASMATEFADHFPHRRLAEQLTDIETEDVIRKILKDQKFSLLRPAGDVDFYIDKIIRTISDAKREALSPDVVEAHAKAEIERIQTDPECISSRGPTKGSLKATALKAIEKCEKTIFFAEVFRRYETEKKKLRKVDYDDLLSELIQAMQKDELFLRQVQEKFLYVLVDEHQDTNDAQNVIIKSIADFFDTPNIFIVGDEKQAVYRFQGASVENFLRFKHIWPTMQLIQLEDNYRSHQNILDASFSLIEKNYSEGEHQDLRVKLRAGKDTSDHGVIHLVRAGNTEAVEQYLVEQVKKITHAHPEKTVAVIVRKNKELERIAGLMDSAGIIAASERGANVFEHPIGLLFFEIMTYLSDPSKTESLAFTLAGGLWNVDFGMMTDLMKSIRAGKTAEIGKVLPALVALQREISTKGAVEYLYRVADVSGVVALATHDPLSMEVWRAIMTLAMELASRDGLADSPQRLMEHLLLYRASAEKKSIKIMAGDPNAKVRLTTAHSAKGLEYDFVFIPYANEEVWLPRAKGSSFVLSYEKEEGTEVKDARRLFYVALTRARESVTILVPLADMSGRVLSPVRFVDEINSDNMKVLDIPSVLLSPKKIIATETTRQALLQNYAKQILSEKGLSVTALNHFMECPNAFLYKSILKVPEPPSATSEKGSAMHHAFDRVWQLKEKNIKTIENEMKTAVVSFFEHSLLPKFEKAAALEALLADIPNVARELLGHFTQKGEIKTETWSEANFSTAVSNVSIQLHGKLDAVIDQGEKVLVFDYKTKEATSDADIRGETKSSDGKYFRQLIFYKLLLATDYRYKGKESEVALVFVKPDEKGRCPIRTLEVTSGDVERVRGEIATLISSVWTGDIFSQGCGENDCVYCRLSQVQR